MTDWQRIVSDLFKDYGRAGLAREVGAGVSTLADLANGVTTEPRHALGVRLLELREAVKDKVA